MSIGSAGADTVVLKNRNKTVEEYSGSVVTADEDKVIIDVECSGKTTELRWNNGLKEIRFNRTCKPEDNVGTGGPEETPNCSKVFMIAASFYMGNEYTSKFKYRDGIINVSEGWSFYIDQRKFTDTGGRMHQIPAYEVSSGGVKSYREPFSIDILHMRNLWGRCPNY
jgi:hypothetical protein